MGVDGGGMARSVLHVSIDHFSSARAPHVALAKAQGSGVERGLGDLRCTLHTTLTPGAWSLPLSGQAGRACPVSVAPLSSRLCIFPATSAADGCTAIELSERRSSGQ